MKSGLIRGALACAAIIASVPLSAQTADVPGTPAQTADVPSTSAQTADVPGTAGIGVTEVPPPAVAAETPAPAVAAAKPCELHVWPTENYLGIKMGLLSGFGALGALADQASNKGSVTSIKDLMRQYLGPEVQLAELRKLNFMDRLGLDANLYAIVMHDPTPWNEDLKKNPELKVRVKELNRKIKAGQRITDSTNPCYAELVTTHIFYHKAMMYGSNLFTGWVYRRFDGDKMTAQNSGQVKNPLEHFPPKDEAAVEPAKAELRDAYAKDFIEWVAKKSGV